MAFRNDFLLKKFLLCTLWWTIVRSQQEITSSDYLVESNEEWTENVHSERIISHSSKKEEKSYISNTYEGFDQNFNLTTLKYVAIITRHGSRSPLHTFPNDPYPFTNLTFWPDGPQQLTRYGKQQLYESGRNIRSRYNGFLSELYVPHEISVRSNVFDRDFMSAACLLAGLYPPSDYQLWNPKIYWQPVPIWEDPVDVSLLVSDPSICPSFEIYQKRSMAEFNSESSQHRNLLEYVSQHVGKKVETLTELGSITDTLIMQLFVMPLIYLINIAQEEKTVENSFTIFRLDAFSRTTIRPDKLFNKICQMEVQENGYKLPIWTKEIYPEPLFTLGAASLAAVSSGSPQMIRLAAGPTLKILNTQISKKAANKMIPNRLMFIEAAHDITLQVLLSSFGFKQYPVKTSAYMIFELHQNSIGQFVQVLYYNTSATITPNVLNLPSCPSPCTLDKFASFVEQVAPQNWEQECNLTKEKQIELMNDLKAALV